MQRTSPSHELELSSRRPGRALFTQERALHYARQMSHHSRWLAELCRLLAFPTVSSEPQRRVHIVAAAQWLAGHLKNLGLEHATVMPGPHGGAPSVYADWRHAPQGPTLLLYGHFDVQPAGPLGAWHTPPFQGTVTGENLHARGASDDKGQLFIHLKALESNLATAGRLPVNVKVWLEGEEEIGSPNLTAFLDRYASRLQADAVLVSDTEMAAPGRPSIVYGLRGNLLAHLEVMGPARNLHSGRYGGVVRNPLEALCQIVAGLHDFSGRVAIPGFYGQVRDLSLAERRDLRQVGPRNEEMLTRLGVSRSWGEPGYSPFERTTIRPALVVHQVSSSGQGAVIPAQARAEIGIRLVPDQEPDQIAYLLQRHIRAAAPSSLQIRLTFRGSSRPVVIARDHPAMRAAARAVQASWGGPPVFIRSGGSIGMVEQLYRRLGVPVILLGFGLPDDGIHGPNEKLHLPTFFRGVETVIRFLAEYAA